MSDKHYYDPETTCVVATGNKHKLEEIKAILSTVLPGLSFVSIKELGDFPDPEETGSTFFENACIKAEAALKETGFRYAMADDSGLVVEALGGAPGIYSARYAGSHGDSQKNNEKLLEELQGVPAEKRDAAFVSCIVWMERDGVTVRSEGWCEGTIGLEPQGTNGFGYDPLFCPAQVPGKTMAELTADEKNSLSHRYRALKKLAGHFTGLQRQS